MKFTQHELQQLSDIRSGYLSAILKRSENPSGFEEQIACLREFEALTHQMESLRKPHVRKITALTQKKLDADGNCNPLPFIKLNHEISNTKDLLKKASKIVFDKLLLDFIKTEFAKEPRINFLTFHEDDKSTKSYRGNQLFEVNNVHNKNYRIKFSDGRILTLHSLDDSKGLELAKKEFLNILSELGEQKRTVLSR